MNQEIKEAQKYVQELLDNTQSAFQIDRLTEIKKTLDRLLERASYLSDACFSGGSAEAERFIHALAGA